MCIVEVCTVTSAQVRVGRAGGVEVSAVGRGRGRFRTCSGDGSSRTRLIWRTRWSQGDTGWRGLWVTVQRGECCRGRFGEENDWGQFWTKGYVCQFRGLEAWAEDRLGSSGPGWNSVRDLSTEAVRAWWWDLQACAGGEAGQGEDGPESSKRRGGAGGRLGNWCWRKTA